MSTITLRLTRLEVECLSRGAAVRIARTPKDIVIQPLPPTTEWTVRDVTVFTGLSRRRLVTLLSQGRIPHMRDGVRVLFAPERVRAWWDAMERGMAEDHPGATVVREDRG